MKWNSCARAVIPKTTEYKMKMPPTSKNFRGPISLVGGESKKLRRLLQRKRHIKVEFRFRVKGAVTLWNVSCNLSRNILATLRRDKLHETFHSVTYLATAKMFARQVARAVAESRIKSYFSCNLSRNDFGRCRECYTVKLFRVTCPAAMSPKHCETSCTKHFTV